MVKDVTLDSMKVGMETSHTLSVGIMNFDLG